MAVLQSFADIIINGLAVVAIGIVACLVWMLLRERRKRRRRRRERTEREKKL